MLAHERAWHGVEAEDLPAFSCTDDASGWPACSLLFPTPLTGSVAQVGKNTINPAGQPMPVEATCSWADSVKPAADVAAHVAAALALSANALRNDTAGGASLADAAIAEADALLRYSRAAAPIGATVAAIGVDLADTASFGVRSRAGC